MGKSSQRRRLDGNCHSCVRFLHFPKGHISIKGGRGGSGHLKGTVHEKFSINRAGILSLFSNVWERGSLKKDHVPG